MKDKLGVTPLTGLIATIVGADGTNGVGIGQGGPLSPLLLNVYLDAVLDRPWTEAFPDVPLLRWVDDALLLCEDRHEAESALRVMSRMLEEVGTPRKTDPPTQVCDLKRGDSVAWLGYELRVLC